MPGVRRATIVGEAPPRSGGGPFEGDAGRRLRRAVRRDLADCRLVNLLNAWPGPDGAKGDAFPVDEARLAARRVRFNTPVVLLAGHRVARAFGLRVGYLEWTTLRGRRAAVLPHPSGINRWWNDPRNRRRASRFIREALGG